MRAKPWQQRAGTRGGRHLGHPCSRRWNISPTADRAQPTETFLALSPVLLVWLFPLAFYFEMLEELSKCFLAKHGPANNGSDKLELPSHVQERIPSLCHEFASPTYLMHAYVHYSRMLYPLSVICVRVFPMLGRNFANIQSDVHGSLVGHSHSATPPFAIRNG